MMVYLEANLIVVSIGSGCVGHKFKNVIVISILYFVLSLDVTIINIILGLSNIVLKLCQGEFAPNIPIYLYAQNGTQGT